MVQVTSSVFICFGGIGSFLDITCCLFISLPLSLCTSFFHSCPPSLSFTLSLSLPPSSFDFLFLFTLQVSFAYVTLVGVSCSLSLSLSLALSISPFSSYFQSYAFLHDHLSICASPLTWSISISLRLSF